jgi:hypothetical protein
MHALGLCRICISPKPRCWPWRVAVWPRNTETLALFLEIKFFRCLKSRLCRYLRIANPFFFYSRPRQRQVICSRKMAEDRRMFPLALALSHLHLENDRFDRTMIFSGLQPLILVRVREMDHQNAYEKRYINCLTSSPSLLSPLSHLRRTHCIFRVTSRYSLYVSSRQSRWCRYL